MMSSTRRQADRGIRPLLHSKRAEAALIVVGGLARLATIGAFAASAAVPAFPDNIVVFPDRDFVTVEGYQDHIGETATVEVTPRRHGHRLRQGRRRGGRRRVRDQPSRRRLLGRGHRPEGHAGHPARRRRVDLVRRRRGRRHDRRRTPTSPGIDRTGRRHHAHRHRPRRLRRQPGADRAAHRQPRPHRHRGRPARHPRRPRRADPGAPRAATRPAWSSRRRHVHRDVRVRRPGRRADRGQPAAASASWPGRRRTPTATARA